MNKCEKCFRPLHTCPGCKGVRNHLICGQCRNTGNVCASHGGFWEK